jgi:hypothetical protein
MTCNAIVAASMIWLASMGGQAAPGAPIAAGSTAARSPLASEPLFARIISRAEALNRQVMSLKGRPLPATVLGQLQTDISLLAEMDMQGHRLLAERGTDGDLKCILRGIAEDLPLKLGAVASSPEGARRDAALTDLGYLLRDNVEVITAPPAPEV